MRHKKKGPDKSQGQSRNRSVFVENTGQKGALLCARIPVHLTVRQGPLLRRIQAFLHQQIAVRANRLFPPPKPSRKRPRIALIAPTLFSVDENGQVQETGGETFVLGEGGGE